MNFCRADRKEDLRNIRPQNLKVAPSYKDSKYGSTSAMRDFVKEYSSVAKLDVLEGLGLNPKKGAITAAAKTKLIELWKDISDEDRVTFLCEKRV